MSQFLDVKRESHRAQRAVSQGAGVTLVAGSGEYVATFDCATRVASVLGDRELKDLGDGIIEVVPSYTIKVEDMFSALQKLATKFSIALVEYAMVRNNGQFILLWKINPARVTTAPKQLTIDDI